MMNNVKTGSYVYNDETHNFNFYTNLSVAKKLEFVNSVVDLVVDENRYNSVIRNLVFDFYIIDIFTDVDTENFIDSNTFLDDVENFLLLTNVAEIVKANAAPTLFDELNDAVDKSIEYITGIHLSPIVKSLSSLFYAVENKVNEIDLNSAMDMVQKFANMTDEFTPESIVNAYMKSDVHKDNLTEIANAKSKK